MWTNPNTVCTFSLDAEEGFRQTSSMESRQSAQLKSIRTASKSSPRDSRLCQCGTMSPHSLGRQESAQKCLNSSGSALTISSLREDFLAKTSALRGIRRESAGKGADSGPNSLVSFAKWDRDSCSWRIPTSLFGSGWDVFSGIWPDSGMMRHGECSALRRSVLVMFAKECGLLQSGITDNKHGISECVWGGEEGKISNPSCEGLPLGGHLQSWAMGCQSKRFLYPTPMESDGRSCTVNAKPRDALSFAIEKGETKNGKYF